MRHEFGAGRVLDRHSQHSATAFDHPENGRLVIVSGRASATLERTIGFTRRLFSIAVAERGRRETSLEAGLPLRLGDAGALVGDARHHEQQV